MNIDIEKLNHYMNEEPFPAAILSIEKIKSFEVKPVNCNLCKNEKHAHICIHCSNNPLVTNNFKPKQNELDSLFIGAPVWYHKSILFGEDDRIRNYVAGSIKSVIRLPTIAEAPRNVWLAPWLEIPNKNDFFKNNMFLFRFKNGDILNNTCYLEESPDWEEVEAIMILDNLKKI